MLIVSGGLCEAAGIVLTVRELGGPVNRKRVPATDAEHRLLQRRRSEGRRRRPGVFRVERPDQLWHLDMTTGRPLRRDPFSSQPTIVVDGEDEHGERKHYVGEIEFANGLLVTPTCDMADQSGEIAHPFRVLVPVVGFEAACDALGTPDHKRGLIRSRDAFYPYLYLPPCPALDEGELLALLARPAMLAEEFLRTPPRRVAQLHPLARRHLKVKLAAYWGRAGINPEALPLYERDEPDPRDGSWPPSSYDDPDDTLAAKLPEADWEPGAASAEV